MSLTAVAFLAVYASLLVLCLLKHPSYGVIGYYATYIISPATRWWGAPLAELGFRYSYFMAAAAVIGMVIHSKHLKPRSPVSGQEVLLWLFVAAAWLSSLLVPPLIPGDDHALKLAKAALMLSVMKRTVIDYPRYRWAIWTMVIASAYGAFDTRLLAGRVGGRIHEGTAGSDFLEGNFLAAHLCMLLPLLGALFLAGGWKTRAFLACVAAIMIDVVIQVRSRGAFLALIAGGGLALCFVPYGHRKRIYPLLVIAAIGAFMLIDRGFLERTRQINLTSAEAGEYDRSAGDRIRAWKAALSMTAAHPLGVGVNNYKALVGQYDYSINGRDTHNTYLRCMAELGCQGMVLLVLLIIVSLVKVYRLRKGRDPATKQYRVMGWATGAALTIYLTAGMFISLTYIEDFYVLLMLPDILANLARPQETQQETVLASPAGACV